MGFIKKNPDPTPRKTRIKTQYPKLQKYPNIYIYIYTYNLTLTNPSFLQSSIFSYLPPSVRSAVRLPHFCTSQLQSDQLSPTVQSAQSLSPISAVPHAFLSFTQSRLMPPSPSHSHASRLPPPSPSRRLSHASRLTQSRLRYSYFIFFPFQYFLY